MSTKLQFKSYSPKQIKLFPQPLNVDIEEKDPVRIVD